MKVKVNFYKQSGKWYAGGIVDIGNVSVHSTNALEQAIVDNQGILMDGWQGQYYVVVDNVSDDDDFCMRLYVAKAFRGISVSCGATKCEGEVSA